MLKRFYPEDFADSYSTPDRNALADGEVDASAALEGALAGLGAAGKGILDVSRGLYRISRGLTLPNSDKIAVEGSGPASGFVVRGPFSPNPSPCVLLSNSQQAYGILNQTALTAWASVGDTAIRVANSNLFPVGSTLRIFQLTTSGIGSTIARYQHNEVAAVIGDTVYLAVALPFDCPISVTVQQTKLRRNLRVGNLGLYGADATGKHNGLVFVWERGAVVEDIYADGQGVYAPDQATGAGIILSDGYQNRLSNATALRCGSDGENAVSLRQQTAFQGSNIATGEGGFGIGIGATDSQFSNLSSDRAWGRAIKFSGAYYNQFSTMRITNPRHTALGFTGGSSDNMIGGLDIRGAKSDGGQNQGIWFNGESNRRNVITMATALNTPGGSLVIPATDDGNIVQFARRPADPQYVASSSSRVSYLNA